MDMKILITKGMICYQKKLFKANQIADVDKAAARRFIRLGVADYVKELAAEPEPPVQDEPGPPVQDEPKQPPDEVQDAGEDTEDAEADDEPVADLPTVDPAAAVTKETTKNGGKKGKK